MLKIIIIVFGVIGVVLLFSILLAFPTMWLWNYLMPELFGLKEIGLGQSMGLLLLCGFLFKSSSTSKSD